MANTLDASSSLTRAPRSRNFGPIADDSAILLLGAMLKPTCFQNQGRKGRSYLVLQASQMKFCLIRGWVAWSCWAALLSNPASLAAHSHGLGQKLRGNIGIAQGSNECGQLKQQLRLALCGQVSHKSRMARGNCKHKSAPASDTIGMRPRPRRSVLLHSSQHYWALHAWHENTSWHVFPQIFCLGMLEQEDIRNEPRKFVRIFGARPGQERS